VAYKDMIITECKSKEDKKLVEYLDTGEYKKVCLVFWHGAGDAAMFLAPLTYLRNKYPNIQIDVGLAAGLQEEVFVEGYKLLEGDWKETIQQSDYDLVFSVHMPLEDLNNTNVTKAEVCCLQELGIYPTSGHLHIKRKPLIGLHFHNTSVSWLTNPTEEVAEKIWREVIEAGCVPVETLFQHGFYSEANSKKFGFVDNHVRNWPARMDTCISLIGACDAFIGVVSGNWHMALCLLPYWKVALLEKDLKVGHFSKLPIKGIDIKNYRDGSVGKWLLNEK
jgi:hypothetical protein